MSAIPSLLRGGGRISPYAGVKCGIPPIYLTASMARKSTIYRKNSSMNKDVAKCLIMLHYRRCHILTNEE